MVARKRLTGSNGTPAMDLGHMNVGYRGVIVVSIVSGGGEVCIAYTSVLVNLWDPKHVLGYLYEYCSVD
jgi:hypothetical protein